MFTYPTDSVCTLNSGGGGGGGGVLEMPNRVSCLPGGHDKVPPMIGGAMPLLNPRLNNKIHPTHQKIK